VQCGGQSEGSIPSLAEADVSALEIACAPHR
jgi:hypothetical protein